MQVAMFGFPLASAHASRCKYEAAFSQREIADQYRVLVQQTSGAGSAVAPVTAQWPLPQVMKQSP
jgi:hypothetical protein